MIFAILFIAELLILFSLSKTLTNLLFTFFYKTTRSKKISMYLMSVIFLPGTFVHELSHAFMSILLQVGVGKMELMPKLIDNNLKLGSVEVAHTDPIRRLLIGMGPFLFGTTLIVGVFFYAVQNNLFGKQFVVIAISYLVFEIGNTMFSSKKDMEGALEVVLALIFIAAIFYLIGFRLPALNPDIIFSNGVVLQTFQKASLYLTAPIGIDLVLIALLKLFKY